MSLWRFHTIYLILSILTQHYSHCQASSTSRHIRILNGHRVTGRETEISRHTSPGLTLIRCAALCQEGCGVFHFGLASALCVIFAEKPYQVEITADPDWDIGYRLFSGDQDVVTIDNWILVFRVQAGANVPAYDTWINTGKHDDSPLVGSFPLDCLRMFDYGSCDRHFRSRHLDNWVGVTKVYLSMIKNDQEVAYIQYDGTGTDMLNWFEVHRITNSTWYPGVKNSTALHTAAGIEGLVIEPWYSRRFMLHLRYAGCEYDSLYMLINDFAYDVCNFDRGVWAVPNYLPSIEYSPSSGPCTYSSLGAYPRGDFADVMAVYVKFN